MEVELREAIDNTRAATGVGAPSPGMAWTGTLEEVAKAEEQRDGEKLQGLLAKLDEQVSLDEYFTL